MTSSWALVRLAHNVAGHFERGFDKLPTRSIVVWAKTVLLGIAVTFATLFTLILYGRYRLGDGARLTWEIELLRKIEEHSPIGFSGAVWFQTFGTDIVLIIIVLTAASIAMWRERPLLGLTILLSMVLLDAAVRIGWMSWERLRPDIIAQGIARPSEHSFPSGHTAKSTAVYGLLIAEWFRASHNIIEKTLAVLLFLVIAIGTPFGRVRMGVHWPTDVMGGWLIASVWLGFLLLALSRAEQARVLNAYQPRTLQRRPGRAVSFLQEKLRLPKIKRGIPVQRRAHIYQLRAAPVVQHQAFAPVGHDLRHPMVNRDHAFLHRIQ